MSLLRTIPFRLRIAVFGLVAVALSIAYVLLPGDRAPKRPTLAQLTATNYRTLTPKQSHELMRYAEAEYRCLAEHGVDLTAPVASKTRITMHAPGKSANALVKAMFPCISIVGEPPQKSSLQARRGLVLVYLPKRCLMDPSELSQS